MCLSSLLACIRQSATLIVASNQDIGALMVVEGGFSMHFCMTEAVAVQNFNWLQPSTKVTQVPTSVVQAMAAKAPRSSPTSQGVRDFVNQAGFQDSPGSTLTTQQDGNAASTNNQQQQGRRLAEVLSKPMHSPHAHDTLQLASSSPCL